MEKLKAGYLQFNPIFGDKEGNLKKVEKIISDFFNSGNTANLIVLPELFTTGYTFLENDNLIDLFEHSKADTFEFMYSLANKYNCAFVYGFAENANGEFFNSQMFVSPDGKSHLYRKIHLFDREKLFFLPGNIEPEPVDYLGFKLGLLVCFDWIFPEIYRTYMLKKTNVICHSTNLVLPWCQKSSFARAVENRMFIIISNRTGTEQRGTHEHSFTGKSIIYTPKGEILNESNDNMEEIRVSELDKQLSTNKWITERNNLIQDRRSEIYKL